MDFEYENNDIFFTDSNYDEDTMNYMSGKMLYAKGEPCPGVSFRDSKDKYGNPSRTPTRDEYQAACGWHYAEWEDNYNGI